MKRGIIDLKALFYLLSAVLCLVSDTLGLSVVSQRQYRRIERVGNRVWGVRGLLSLSKGTERCSTAGHSMRLGMAQFGDSLDGSAGGANGSEDNLLAKGGPIDLLYDGECPICMMEVEFLKKRDVNRRIRFTNLQDPSYNPADHGNVTFEDGMRKLRAVMPDGRVVIGVEVFRQTYKAIGLGWIFELTSLPVIGKVADNLYDVWAANRLRLTGKGDLADILVARAKETRGLEPIEDCEEECGLDFEELEE
jgi:predicted DCC family thiol-disulfide oxidoreductase YuxK